MHRIKPRRAAAPRRAWLDGSDRIGYGPSRWPVSPPFGTLVPVLAIGSDITLSKLVILARDGVINLDLGRPIRDPDDWQPIPGSLEAIARLSQAGFLVTVATNQPGLALGSLDLDALNAVHHRLHDRLDRVGGHLVAIAYCPHGPAEGCDCRKPQAGMHRCLLERFGVVGADAIVVGDRPTDLAPAHALGARAIWVRTGRVVDTCNDDNVEVFDDLSQVATVLLKED